MYKTVTTGILLNILLNFLVQAIIVERNLHSYYRLPTTTVKTSNDSDDYYILQCPFKSTMNIPKAKDMPICLIVGRHSEKVDKQKDLLKSKPRTTLKTQVVFHHLNPSNLLKLVKIKNGKPYTLLLKPMNKQEAAYKKPNTFIKEQYKVPNAKFVLTNPTSLLNQSGIFYNVPLIQKLQMNDSLALSSTKESQKLNAQTQKSATSLETDFVDDPLDNTQETQKSPLKYLGVQNALKTLQLATMPLHAQAKNQTQYKSEKFFADTENYKKGFRTKGYQNMYHRDETYQDHIFYDDLQQMGNYRSKQKVQQKQP